MELTIELTTSYDLYEHFEIYLYEEPFILDLYLDLDYSTVITKEDYFAYDPQIEIISAEDYLTETLVDRGMIFEEESYIIQDLVDNYYMPIEFIDIRQTYLDILADITGDEIVLAFEFEA